MTVHSCIKEDIYDNVRRWCRPRILDTSEDHSTDQFLFSNSIDAANIEPWIEGPFLRFNVNNLTSTEADELYDYIYKLYVLDVPTVLLAKQPLTYPLFFDVDIKGTLNADNVNDTLALLQLDKLTLFRHLVKALQEVYEIEPMTLVIYQSHGVSIPLSEGFRGQSYAKASFHVVFPDIIVDRPENCLQRSPNGEHNKVPMKRHMVIMDHVRLYFKQSNDPDLHNLMDQLRPLDNDSWEEIFDENPLWHERWDDLTGMRLCYTKKKGEKQPRVKLPWKAFRVVGADFHEFTDDVDRRQWSEWGNVQDPRGIREVTPWREAALRRYDGSDEDVCECRLCYYDKKYQPANTPGWETGWEKARDPASGEIYYWHAEKEEGFWQCEPGQWARVMHPERGYFFWRCEGPTNRYFWDP